MSECVSVCVVSACKELSGAPAAVCGTAAGLSQQLVENRTGDPKINNVSNRNASKQARRCQSASVVSKISP